MECNEISKYFKRIILPDVQTHFKNLLIYSSEENNIFHLKCAISKKAITSYPARGIECSHLFCYEAENLINLIKNNEFFVCSCSKIIHLENIYIDIYLYVMIKQIHEGEKTILVKKSTGKWSYAKDNIDKGKVESSNQFIFHHINELKDKFNYILYPQLDCYGAGISLICNKNQLQQHQSRISLINFSSTMPRIEFTEGFSSIILDFNYIFSHLNQSKEFNFLVFREIYFYLQIIFTISTLSYIVIDQDFCNRHKIELPSIQ